MNAPQVYGPQALPQAVKEASRTMKDSIRSYHSACKEHTKATRKKMGKRFPKTPRPEAQGRTRTSGQAPGRRLGPSSCFRHEPPVYNNTL